MRNVTAISILGILGLVVVIATGIFIFGAGEEI